MMNSVSFSDTIGKKILEQPKKQPLYLGIKDTQIEGFLKIFVAYAQKMPPTNPTLNSPSRNLVPNQNFLGMVLQSNFNCWNSSGPLMRVWPIDEFERYLD